MTIFLTEGKYAGDNKVPLGLYYSAISPRVGEFIRFIGINWEVIRVVHTTRSLTGAVGAEQVSVDVTVQME